MNPDIRDTRPDLAAGTLTGPPTRKRMKVITMKFSIKELELLTTLASDQLFRREFIDPKMPGYKTDSGELRLAKVLVTRLRTLLDPSAARRIPVRVAG
jgi:hypothetical protein